MLDKTAITEFFQSGGVFYCGSNKALKYSTLTALEECGMKIGFDFRTWDIDTYRYIYYSHNQVEVRMNCIYTSPNQKVVQTKKTVSDKANLYSKCNIEACLEASRVLTDRAFKLYIRMNLHQDGFTYALSPVEILEQIGMSEKRYHYAVRELIEKGYLVRNESNKMLYDFYETHRNRIRNNKYSRGQRWIFLSMFLFL